ncbi:MAG: GNAT family N-acetyltransferase [Parachlamydiales bacterium]
MRKLTGRKVKVVRQMAGLEVRYSVPEDGEHWARWIRDPEVARFYPMGTDSERAESVEKMQAVCKWKAALTAVYQGEVAGIAYLNLHPYKKIAHQCVFTVIVGKEFRGKGVGGVLLDHLERLAKEGFGQEMLHLELYEGNPAIRLYRRLGYLEFGFQSHWILEASGFYKGKIFMAKWL